MRRPPEIDDWEDVPHVHAPRRKERPDHFEIHGWTSYVGSGRTEVRFVYPKAKRKIHLQNAFTWEELHGDVKFQLDRWAEEFPETADWPVRFVNLPPIDLGREILRD